MDFFHKENINGMELYRINGKKEGNWFYVLKDRGAIVTRLCLNNNEILYLNSETLFEKSKNIRGGIPILFPVCGRVNHGKILFNGQEYLMKNHGFARDLPWSCEGFIESVDDNGIIFSLQSSKETLEVYPFDFKVYIIYKIGNGYFRIEFDIENRSDHFLPFYAGFHPYFLSKKDMFSIEAEYAYAFDDVSKSEIKIPINNYLDFSNDEINVDLFQVKSPVNITLSEDISIHIEFEKSYKNIVIWSLKDFPFVCVEPWMGEHEGHLKGDFVLLPPHDVHTSYIEIKLN